MVITDHYINFSMSRAEIIEKFGKVPKYIKYSYKNDIIYSKVVGHYYNNNGYFVLDIIHTKELELSYTWKRTWPYTVVLGKQVLIEEATQEEYLASMVLES